MKIAKNISITKYIFIFQRCLYCLLTYRLFEVTWDFVKLKITSRLLKHFQTQKFCKIFKNKSIVICFQETDGSWKLQYPQKTSCFEAEKKKQKFFIFNSRGIFFHLTGFQVLKQNLDFFLIFYRVFRRIKNLNPA